MKPTSVFAMSSLPLVLAAALATCAQAQARDTVVWRVTGVARCAKADSLFGRQWRSHVTGVRVAHSHLMDMTTIRTPVHTVSWQPGASRLVGSEAFVQAGGALPLDSARLSLVLRFVDTIYRASEQARIELVLDDSSHAVVEQPDVDYPMGAPVHGIPLVVTAMLTPAQSLALARARAVKGTMGPWPFMLFDWELWDINAVYRATVCGLD